MRDYAKRGLLSLLIPAFRGTTGVSTVGSLCIIQIYPAAYCPNWDLPRSFVDREKNCYSNTMSIRFTVLCGLYLNTFYFLSLSSTDVLRRNINESKSIGNVDVCKVEKTCSEFNWMQCALMHLSRRAQIDIKMQFNVKKP